ncbi:NAD(P)-dependent dehydrogenase, short-chain alcohol dehydrogenase family [Pedobacter westerhofensis]|uniref:NAD(P)-dependent dehydrogenase, short-chain alcohol dehydrogenase family n=1 Tax=Pedobacter westerhofensis TaxID=425512 RepID=A0A521CSI6_9SPHI|nr:glucose 1-dehydrogenase [Pedobacter westerhofensis]SMO62423.1 NAD(P)-dependent dehydrogenase, short-chain alcohol dehydrogenase family [Pedobacter westerhofensis]
MKLKDKVAVITGGNSGIGFGVAEAFKNEGAIGAIVGRTQETLDKSIQQLGDSFIAINADVTKSEDLDNVFKQTADRFGSIDILVVNAGGPPDSAKQQTVVDTSEDVFDKFIALNQKAVYFTVQKAVPYMNEGSSIILMSSFGGRYAFEGMCVYSGCKAAIRSYARGFSQDLLSRKIRVNAILPGTIDTPIFGKALQADQVEEYKKQTVQTIPVGRIGLPADIGPAAVFLASDESSFVVGTEILIDGGVLNLSPQK